MVKNQGEHPALTTMKALHSTMKFDISELWDTPLQTLEENAPGDDDDSDGNDSDEEEAVYVDDNDEPMLP